MQCGKSTQTKPGMGVHTCNPELRRWGKKSGFKVILDYKTCLKTKGRGRKKKTVLKISGPGVTDFRKSSQKERYFGMVT